MGSTEGANGLAQDTILILVPAEPRQEVIDSLQSRYPGVKIHWRTVYGTPITVEDIPKTIWDTVTILWGFQIPKDAVTPNLRFVQLSSAGADHWASNPHYQDPNVVFCTSNGAHPPQIAEWVIGSWLSHQHQFLKFSNYMKEGYWEPLFQSTFQDSWGLRMGVLGYGAIGRQCANLAKGLGMDVVAYTAHERPTSESKKDDSYCVPGTGDPDGLIPSKWFHGTTQETLNNFLNQDLDILVVCLPLTPSTRNMISKPQFEILAKKKTFLSNIARGGHVNTEDLIEALEKGMIRGAAVDVTDPEPLPKEHPLWKVPNLLITPHVSWVSTNHWSRLYAIFEHNLGVVASNKGKFVNQVNKQRHY
ncbi:uncharacterized protein PV06_00597 [Exophiala oligosperma]|uniref:D-isomer specific 2-hydroxyacid dehydrogenase NAD-binding domain-containing protein n=1 Tax=Exophiala oligosperma TaxID=215243 RepID=A0A0D2EJ58_9EURO|nr:uncharacterized protein PV06_00597 [Exophiala oligosperma]KIW47949.1 hypothetical protein PV06_00597 [Exophiala oligosperma]